MEVTLDAEETEALMDILRTYRSDLQVEISDTDNPGYKRPLKKRRELIDSMVEKLTSATGAKLAAHGESSPPTSLRIVAIFG